MFKNLTINIFEAAPSFAALTAGLEGQKFAPCGATQSHSTGWVPVRGEEHGALVEAIGGHYLMRWVEERRVVPASTLADLVEKKCAAIEKESGRVPGKKERSAIKDDARLELLPQALISRAGVLVWIDPVNCTMGFDTTSTARSDSILTALVEAIKNFKPRMLLTERASDSAMAQWLIDQDAPGLLALGNECDLAALDESRACVRYARHDLEIEEIRQHIQAGKRPTRLALIYSDRVSFVLTNRLQLRKLQFASVLFEGKHDADAFDADIAICTGELRAIINQLTNALGGILQ